MISNDLARRRDDLANRYNAATSTAPTSGPTPDFMIWNQGPLFPMTKSMASSPIAVEGAPRAKSPPGEGPPAPRDASYRLPPPSFRGQGDPRKFAPASLPRQRAPYLSSRKAPRDELSRIPDVVLPESAVPTSSAHYGSLRERGRWGGGAFHAGGGLYDLDEYYAEPPVVWGNQGSFRKPFLSRCGGDDAGGIVEGGARITISEMTLGPRPPLRSSLTALDVLTRLSRNGPFSTPPQGQWSGLSPSRVMPQLDESRLAFGAGGECHWSPTAGSELGDDASGNANPDTFEAFDLDLD